MPITIKKRNSSWSVSITHENKIKINFNYYDTNKAEAEKIANKLYSNSIAVLDALHPIYPNAHINGDAFYIRIHTGYRTPYAIPIPAFLRLSDPDKLAHHAHSVLTHKINEKQITLDCLADRLRSASAPTDIQDLFSLARLTKERRELTAFTNPNNYNDFFSIEYIDLGILHLKNTYYSVPHVTIRINKILSAFEILHYDDALIEILAYAFKPIQIAKTLSAALPLLFPHPLPTISISSDSYYLTINAHYRDYQQLSSIFIDIPNDRFVQTPADDLAGELIQDLTALL
ncbi:MAG: hypothetical protein DRQ10_04705 [Candidatus Hydrothermota bacterium]|nr:MAG: hypothetical protein DRQ10_04705 [Candidatus Hydrothermae bacterium]